ncbi:MAG: DNA polymerase III subunit delta [Clostridioides sp.]|jgi:DNA polymerase-3 subunit delta|nr:DNA polymerase III subunit delta [Clostridioides sp.]
MNYKDIAKDIQEGRLSNLYLFYGKEFYLLDRITDLFKSTLNQMMLDFNLERLDGTELTFEKLQSVIETLPLMDERKVIIVKDFEILKGKKKNFTDADEKALSEYMDKLPETTVLVFVVYGDIDKRKSFTKKITKVGTAVECNKLTNVDLFQWVRSNFEKREAVIQNAQIAYFIENVGYNDKTSEKNLSDLENDIEKISSFVGKGGNVTNQAIDGLLERKIENDIFRLIDSIGSKNSSNAMKILSDIIESGEAILGVYAMLARQLKMIIQVRNLRDEKMSVKLISDTLKIRTFMAEKAMRQANNFTDEDLIDMLNFILESDYKIKTGLIDDTLSAEIFIAKYCRR